MTPCYVIDRIMHGRDKTYEELSKARCLALFLKSVLVNFCYYIAMMDRQSSSRTSYIVFKLQFIPAPSPFRNILLYPTRAFPPSNNFSRAGLYLLLLWMHVFTLGERCELSETIGVLYPTSDNKTMHANIYFMYEQLLKFYSSYVATDADDFGMLKFCV